MPRSIRSVIMVLVVTFFIGNTSFVLAQDIPLVQESALREDAQWYAARFSVDIDEALRRLQLQTHVGEVNSVLTEKIPEILGGVWIKHEPAFHIVVQLTEGDTNTVLPYISNPDIIAALEVERVAVTQVELDLAMKEAGLFIEKIDIQADISLDTINNNIDIYILDEQEFEQAKRRAGIETPQNIEIETVLALAQPAADIRGGYATSDCTTGFSVQDGVGTKGILTAGHCSNAQTYLSTSLPYQAGRADTSYDVQWNTTPGYTPINQIFTGSSNRSITSTKSRSSQVVGEAVCKYGKNTGYTCGQIQSTSYNPGSGYILNPTATFIRVQAANTTLVQGGDSGGPWFSGNTAYGITSGYITLSSGQVDGVYMAINYVSGISVTVLTS